MDRYYVEVGRLGKLLPFYIRDHNACFGYDGHIATVYDSTVVDFIVDKLNERHENSIRRRDRRDG